MTSTDNKSREFDYGRGIGFKAAIQSIGERCLERGAPRSSHQPGPYTVNKYLVPISILRSISYRRAIVMLEKKSKSDNIHTTININYTQLIILLVL